MFFENQGLCHIGEKILDDLDFQSQMECRSVRKSWRAIFEKMHQKVHNDFLENHFSRLVKNVVDKNRKIWLKFAKMIWNEAPFIAKSYLIHFVMKYDGKRLETPLYTFIKVGNFKIKGYI